MSHSKTRPQYLKSLCFFFSFSLKAKLKIQTFFVSLPTLNDAIANLNARLIYFASVFFNFFYDTFLSRKDNEMCEMSIKTTFDWLPQAAREIDIKLEEGILVFVKLFC